VNRECRCPHCNKLFAKLRLLAADHVEVEVWCDRCHRLVVVAVRRQAA
jgi:phage FluMu protein Com